MGGCTKCSWTQDRLSRRRSGSKSIGDSGKARSIDSPPIWTRRPSERKGRRRASLDVSCMFGKRALARSWRSVGRWIDDVRIRQISRKKTQKPKSEETKMRLQEIEPERETNHLNLKLKQVPVTSTGMLIRKPVAEVLTRKGIHAPTRSAQAMEWVRRHDKY